MIPGNDDAIRAIRLYTQAAADAILEGRKAAQEAILAGDEEFVEVEERIGASEPPIEPAASPTSAGIIELTMTADEIAAGGATAGKGEVESPPEQRSRARQEAITELRSATAESQESVKSTQARGVGSTDDDQTPATAKPKTAEAKKTASKTVAKKRVSKAKVTTKAKSTGTKAKTAKKTKGTSTKKSSAQSKGDPSEESGAE